ncbi:DNA polymerase III subunit delta [Pelagibacteraceae bacterium]|nr:DNA polymerase III subunit delta [Pelagibacteraceae bacterium]
MILKSYIIEKDISSINNYTSLLFYGENDGLKEDIKNEIKKINKSAEIINLFQEEIIKNNSIVLKELENLSLFNEKKIVFIYEATDKIFKLIYEVLDKLSDQTKVFLFSRALDKRSKLRAHYEKDKDLGIIPCYQDNERTLSSYISIKLKSYTGLSQEIINLIVNNSNNDRRLINAEITKIKNFYIEKKIDKENLVNLLNIKFDNDFNKIRDASLVGNRIKVNRLMGEIDFLPENTFFFLYNIGNRINKLLEIQEIMKSTKDSELALDSMQPKIFWKDKPVYIDQLKKWDKNNLEKALSAVAEIELLIKNNSTIRNDILIKNLLVSLCKSASKNC